MTTLPAVVAVGQHSPRWLYAERIDGPCYVGRVWTRDNRKANPHWSTQRRRYSVRFVNLAAPADPKPEPPA
jgi:hypothetical protein